MGIFRTGGCERSEIEECRRMLLSCARVYRKKQAEEDEEFGNLQFVPTAGGENDAVERGPVCVTGGVSFLSLAILNRLLLGGYSVRIIVRNQEDLEKVRETEVMMRARGDDNVEVVMANLLELESLGEALEGCCGVFHTSDFIDASGLSGYSKHMVDIEVKASENVMEACARTSSVRRCVFTSSLLACIWLDKSRSDDLPSVITHDCWTDESLCIDKKLWYALGKVRAEKAAWRVAKERGLNLVSICPALITGPQFCNRNPTPSIAYLKGAQEMYENGLLATVDVGRLAEAHVRVFDAMNKTASGRYVCFDRVVEGEEEFEKLVEDTGLRINRSASEIGTSNFRFEVSCAKLSMLMSRSQKCRSQCRNV